jgi:hypothetical protein
MEKIAKYINIFLWVIVGITAILAISFMTNISSDETNPDMLSWLSTNLIWTYILLILSIIFLLGFGVIQLVSNFKESKKALLSLVGIGVIVLIAYLLSSEAIPVFLGSEKFVEQGILTPKVSKWVDTGLFTTYVFFAISIVAIVYSSIRGVFK